LRSLRPVLRAERRHGFMDIRVYRHTDRAAVIELWRECGLVKAQNNPDADIDRKLEVNPELFLVGIDQGALIATVMGGYEGHRGWINYLAVSPGAQRKGYGKAMMDAVELKIAALGCPKINLQVRAGNDVVLEFYASLGYASDPVTNLGKRLLRDD